MEAANLFYVSVSIPVAQIYWKDNFCCSILLNPGFMQFMV